MSLEIKIPNQYLCDLKKVECVPVIDETSVESKHLSLLTTKKYCEKICKVSLRENRLLLYQHSKECAEKIILLLKNKDKTSARKLEVEYKFTDANNNIKPIKWKIFGIFEKKMLTLFYEHNGVEFHILKDLKTNSVTVEITSFYYDQAYDATLEKWTAEEIFFMSDVLAMGFADLNMARVNFELADGHFKTIQGKNSAGDFIKIKVPTYAVNFLISGERFYENKGFYYLCHDISFTRSHFFIEAKKLLNMSYVTFIQKYFSIKEYFFKDISAVQKLNIREFLQMIKEQNIMDIYDLMERTFNVITPENINEKINLIFNKLTIQECYEANKLTNVLTEDNILFLTHFHDIDIDVSEFVRDIRKKRVLQWIKNKEVLSLFTFMHEGDEFNSETKYIFTIKELKLSYSSSDEELSQMFSKIITHIEPAKTFGDVLDLNELIRKLIFSYDAGTDTITLNKIQNFIIELMKKGASPFDKDKTNERQSLFMELLENKKISIKTSDMLLSLIPEKERSLLNFKFI